MTAQGMRLRSVNFGLSHHWLVGSIDRCPRPAGNARFFLFDAILGLLRRCEKETIFTSGKGSAHIGRGDVRVALPIISFSLTHSSFMMPQIQVI